MLTYSVRGRTAATAATLNHVIAALWNQSSTKRINVVEWGLSSPATGATREFSLRRITTRGTPGSTVTPGVQNAFARDVIPPSAALLDMAAYTAQPTIETDGFVGWKCQNVAAIGLMVPMPREIEIGPGAGIAFVTLIANVHGPDEVWFQWEE